MELCATGKGCYSNEYKDFAFENLGTILSMDTTAQIDFQAWWAMQVADKFGMAWHEVAICYSDEDPYNTDGNLRSLWKYATAKGVNGTPTAFLNGVKLDSVPMTVDGWIDLLNSTVESQFGFVNQAKFPQS